MYITPDAAGDLQLAALPLATKQPIVLTNAPHGIMDYAVSPDGKTVVYSAWREDGGSDLWSIQVEGRDNGLLLPCPLAACGRAAWKPDGKQFAFEKHGGSEGQGLPSLWLYDVQTQSAQPMFPEAQEARGSASWSPDGRWLSTFLAEQAVAEVVNATGGRRYVLSDHPGDPPKWDPTGNALLSLEVRSDGDQTLAHLVRLDLTTGDQLDMGTAKMADREAAWSPMGDWLAVTRRDWTGKYPSKTQIWLMRSDGTEARAVLADSAYQYLSPVWSPDGNYLLFQRYSNDQAFIQPEVWMLDLQAGETTKILPSAGQVVWLP